MSKKALITLKSKPKAPKRRKIKYQTELTEGMTLGKLLESFGGTDEMDDIYFEEETECDYYDRSNNYHTAYFTIERYENDEVHQKQVERYKVHLARYEKWYKENEETILAEIARRKVEAEEKAQRGIERIVKQLKREQKTLKKNLAGIESRLRK